MKINVPSNPFKHDDNKNPTAPKENHKEEGGIRPKTPLTKDAIEQLKALVHQHKKDKRYQEAIKILEELIGQKDGCFVLIPNIEKAKCLIENGDIEEAKALCEEIIAAINSEEFSIDLKGKLEDCDVILLELAELLVQHNEVDIAIKLAHCIFKIVTCFYEGEVKLIRLMALGDLMQDIAKEMAKQERHEEFRLQYQLLEDTLEEMLIVDGVDLKIKGKDVGWLLKCLGFCCDEARDFERSKSYHEQAINLMKTVFAGDFNQHKVVGVCYNNIGATEENTGKYDSAKQAYEKALDVYYHVQDWKMDDQKSEIMELTTKNIARVMEKLASGTTNKKKLLNF